ncbi:TraB family protein [Natronoarchaeum philippinense]|uniref:TraB family protein n=1 Tax=Natronoarchaeum philippinense TaxID=558529 RepID=A0A285N5K1_NATPI|nr:TraB/GumN family protein [Natronoarchaeum philippinense]SNZ04722.1 TraB family protein [Natronoarchaeum philippinense]
MTEPAEPDGAPADPDTPGSVTVVGTAHVSAESAARVEDEIRESRPDVVAVELDEGRYRQMKGEAAADIEAKDLLGGNTVFQFLAYWMLSYVQSRMGDRFDIEPGADMKAATETAEELGLGVALVDRDIQVTMQRFWTRLTLGEKFKLIGGLAVGITDPLTLGLVGGAGVGMALGALFGQFLAPALGLGGLFTLGVTSTAALQLLGGLVGGAVFGLGVGLFVLPSIRPPGPLGDAIDGFSFRLLLGVLAGAGAGVALAFGNPLPAGVVGSGSFVAVGETVIRLLSGAALGGLVGIALGAVAGLVLGTGVEEVDDELDEEFDIESLTDGDVVSAMMEEFRRFSPGGAEALIDERDAFIASRLDTLRSQGYDVVAVVGAGHRAGIERYLDAPEELPDIESISGTASGRRFSIGKVVGYLFTLGFAAFFFLLLMAGVQDTFLLQLFGAWFLINGVFAFGMARLAGARWLSAGVGGAVAWLTSINPMLAPGWFAGYVELRQRPVNVSDIQRLNEILDDTESPLPDLLQRMFDVPLFRLIMVVAMTNIGSIIASFLFATVVVPAMAPEIGGISGITSELLSGARNSAELIVEAVR